MIITLLRVSQFIPCLTVLTLFQGHRFVRNIIAHFVLKNCAQYSLNVVWLLHTLKKKHALYALYGSGGYLREIATNVWVVKCLGMLKTDIAFLLGGGGGHNKCDTCQTLHDGTIH